MADSDFEEIGHLPAEPIEAASDFEDVSILCIDCAHDFIWTAGEQTFYRDKQLLNPPKRCKECKKAKNSRLQAIELSRLTGQKHRIEVRAECARCSEVTTVPFYPCQGRPVYCRNCFAQMNPGKAAGSNGTG